MNPRKHTMQAIIVQEWVGEEGEEVKEVKEGEVEEGEGGAH